MIGDSVHVASLGGTLYALQRETGKLQWQLRPAPDSGLSGDLATDGVRLFVATTRSDDKGVSSVVAIDRP